MTRNRRITARTVLFACLGTLMTATVALAQLKGEALLKEARISLAEARQIALKVRPGTIAEQELEREKGGSGLRYSFDINSGGATYEVGVDAKTGAVLENAVEGKKPD